MFVFKGVNFYVYHGEEGWEGSSTALRMLNPGLLDMRANHRRGDLQKFQDAQVFPGLVEATTTERRDKTAARFDPIGRDFPIAPGE